MRTQRTNTHGDPRCLSLQSPTRTQHHTTHQTQRWTLPQLSSGLGGHTCEIKSRPATRPRRGERGSGSPTEQERLGTKRGAEPPSNTRDHRVTRNTHGLGAAHTSLDRAGGSASGVMRAASEWARARAPCQTRSRSPIARSPSRRAEDSPDSPFTVCHARHRPPRPSRSYEASKASTGAAAPGPRRHSSTPSTMNGQSRCWRRSGGRAARCDVTSAGESRGPKAAALQLRVDQPARARALPREHVRDALDQPRGARRAQDAVEMMVQTLQP